MARRAEIDRFDLVMYAGIVVIVVALLLASLLPVAQAQPSYHDNCDHVASSAAQTTDEHDDGWQNWHAACHRSEAGGGQ